MMILSVNAGSSSLKISVYDDDQSINNIANATIQNISSPPALFIFNGEEIKSDDNKITDHASAFDHFLSRFSTENIRYVCHRVVHGGDYTTRVIIDDTAYHHIQSLSDLAPLHNAAALAVIKASLLKIPHAKNVAYFDSAFHKTIPKHIATYPIDQNVALKRGLVKYGFHGLSYAFILRSVASFLNKSPSSLNLIVLHLGSGASACAIKAGQSLDTSMGLTPLSGLPGATRSGAVDPSLIFHYTNKAERITHDPNMAVDLKVTEAEDILNRKSGWKALTGTADFRVITERASLTPSSTPSTTQLTEKKPTKGDADVDVNDHVTGKHTDHNPHALAFHLFVDRILDFVGAYHLKLGGQVDALVFSGGIGEKSKELRQVVAEKVRCLGYAEINSEVNAHLGDGVVLDIGKEMGKQKSLLVCRTDEQLEMARACALDQDFWSRD